MVVQRGSGPRGSLLDPVFDARDWRRGPDDSISPRCARTLIAVVRVGGARCREDGRFAGRLSGVGQLLHTQLLRDDAHSGLRRGHETAVQPVVR